MRRLFAFLLRNWPLKLAAIGLATVLYAGLVLSENTRSWPGQVPIEVLRPPAGGALLELPGAVTSIRYRAPIDVASQLTNGSFRASVDLSRVVPQAGGAAVEVLVLLVPIDARVQIVDYTPRVVNIRVDQVVGRTVPVTVDRGTVPEGLVLGPPQVGPTMVSVRGASSRVATVASVMARVAIDASGLNVDQEVDVEVIDETGNPVAGVEVDPQRVRVRIDVARQLAYATLPVVPSLSGEPVAGNRVAAVTVTPQTATVSGEAPAVGRLGSVSTAAIDLGGHDSTFETVVALAPPADITVIGPSTVTVRVTIARTLASRSFEVGVTLQGARADRVYNLSAPSVLATLTGPASLLDTLEPAQLRARVGVAGLALGPHDVKVSLTPPDGLDVVSIGPATLNVRVALPAATPTPGPSPTPSRAPEASGAATSAAGPAVTTPAPRLSPTAATSGPTPMLAASIGAQ